MINYNLIRCGKFNIYLKTVFNVIASFGPAQSGKGVAISLSTFRKFTGMDRKKIISSLAELEKMGMISSKKSYRTVTVYYCAGIEDQKKWADYFENQNSDNIESGVVDHTR